MKLNRGISGKINEAIFKIDLFEEKFFSDSDSLVVRLLHKKLYFK